MRFGIDYDQTWTEDPELFAMFVKMIWKRGHSACIVTLRDRSDASYHEIRQSVDKHLGDKAEALPIVHCGGEWKKHVTDAMHLEVDVWVDDTPNFIQPPYVLADMRRYWTTHGIDPRGGFNKPSE